MTTTMKAVVLDGPGPPEALRVRRVPLPEARPGEVLIRVRAFGLNRSELHFRQGLAESGGFPRIPGIEAAGTVESSPGGEFSHGSQVVTMMGGMGRTFDGGYAEFVVVPAGQVIPFRSSLGWDQIGSLPEMLQTAYGSLRVGVGARDGQTLLVRGGTSSVGLAVAALASRQGVTVYATTRREVARPLLEAAGASRVLIDDGAIAARVRELQPGGVDGAVELVGVNVLKDTIRAVRPGGTACFTGMLSDEWTIPEFYPMDWLPNGVRLTAYSGESSDLPQNVLQDFLDDVASGESALPVGRVYGIDDIVQAHRDMEAGTVGGKGVVLTRPEQARWSPHEDGLDH